MRLSFLQLTFRKILIKHFKGWPKDISILEATANIVIVNIVNIECCYHAQQCFESPIKIFCA